MRQSTRQFRNPVHCAPLADDGLLYVCDRANIASVFKPDGTFVKEQIIEKRSWAMVVLGHRFSKDPGQNTSYSRWAQENSAHPAARDSPNLDDFGDGDGSPSILRRAQHRHGFEGTSTRLKLPCESFAEIVYKAWVSGHKRRQGVLWPKK